MLLNTDFLAATLLCLYCSILPTLQEPTGKLCPVKKNAPGCICDSFDLSSLGSTDNVPRFTGLSDPTGFAYDFNPCNTFTGSGDCSDVYICQSGFNGDTYEIATTGDEGIYIDTDDIPYIYYTGPRGRQVRVTLVCDESDAEPSVTTLGDSDPGSFLIYKFTLTAKAACPISGGGGSAAGIAGIVMMILLLAGIAAYFVIGGVVMKFRYQKNGSDLIINKVFWFALPGLIKEGFVFTFAPCLKLIKGGLNRGDGYKEQL